jgi:hypothetical protein
MYRVRTRRHECLAMRAGNVVGVCHIENLDYRSHDMAQPGSCLSKRLSDRRDCARHPHERRHKRGIVPPSCYRDPGVVELEREGAVAMGKSKRGPERDCCGPQNGSSISGAK